LVVERVTRFEWNGEKTGFFFIFSVVAGNVIHIFLTVFLFSFFKNEFSFGERNTNAVPNDDQKKKNLEQRNWI
jgi:hypothetical protein